MNLRLFLTLSIFFLLSACREKEQEFNTLTDSEVHTITIDIQPFEDVPKKITDSLFQDLSKIHSKITVKSPIKLPSSAFYSKRSRYRADSLISFLKRKTPTNHVTIGLTTKDISTTKGNIEDYGIMGLGYQPGRSCVVSTFRLKQDKLQRQFFKVSIHELGHTAGLPHCKTATCFMRDAEGKNHLDKETNFCEPCKSHLLLKGWRLN